MFINHGTTFYLYEYVVRSVLYYALWCNEAFFFVSLFQLSIFLNEIDKVGYVYIYIQLYHVNIEMV